MITVIINGKLIEYYYLVHIFQLIFPVYYLRGLIKSLKYCIVKFRDQWHLN